MNIYFIRHGATLKNENGVYYGALDVPLSDRGIAQCRKLYEKLKGVKFQKTFVSPLKRAVQTLEIINPSCPVFKDERIKERNFGAFEGLSYEGIQKKFPEEYKRWMESWDKYAPPCGESFEEFYKRVELFMREIQNESAENILVVTHGGVIRAAYCYILGGNPDFYWKFASRNADISLIKYEDGYMYIDSIMNIGQEE